MHTSPVPPALSPQSILADMHASIANYDRRIESAKSAIVSHGWVVTSHGLPLRFDVDAEHRVTGVHVVGWAGAYSQLTNAESIARSMGPICAARWGWA